ncbi:MAG: ATP synthase F1 subunit delta [Candidatus Hydrogenedens sp.]|jgi:F-type H+-transporting ATPase subunit delta|nr:ATP synthase F1 subunit delta [Candidatus Hydrogenedens sp.]
MTPAQIADKYTRALRATLQSEEDLLQTVTAYRQFMAICNEEPTLLRYLNNPVIPLEDRRLLLKNALEACNPPPSMTALAHLLLERNRFSLLPLIVSQFEKQIDKWLDRVEVEVITAVPLTEELRSQVHQTMEHFTKKTVRMHNTVDPDIIGGLIAKMQGLALDFSYRSRLEQLQEKLLSEESSLYGA